MEKKIEVVRKKHGISYIPQHYVNRLAHDANIISIVGDGEYRPEFKPTQNVLKLTTGLSGISGGDMRQAVAFLESLDGANFFIHCYMGQIRSKQLAQSLALRYPKYQVLKHATNFKLL